jgi:hypothetical protein
MHQTKLASRLREASLYVSLLESWCREGGSDCHYVLILNKLLKMLDAQGFEYAGNAVLEYATSTRDLRGSAIRVRSFFDLGKTADRLRER